MLLLFFICFLSLSFFRTFGSLLEKIKEEIISLRSSERVDLMKCGCFFFIVSKLCLIRNIIKIRVTSLLRDSELYQFLYIL